MKSKALSASNSHESPCHVLHEQTAILNSLSAMIQQQSTNADYSQGELLGVAYILRNVVDELQRIEEQLRAQS